MLKKIFISFAALLALFVSMLFVSAPQCDLDNKKGIAAVRFAWHELYVPAQQISLCSELPESSNPARITMAGKFPDFSALPYGPHLKNDPDVIQLHYYGAFERDKDIKLIAAETDLSALYQRAVVGKVWRKEIPKYQKPVQTKSGLLWYKTNIEPHGADVYIGRDEKDEIDLFLTCNPEKRGDSCMSSTNRMFENVTYSYSFSKSHINKAREIDAMMQSFVESTKHKPGP